MSRINIPLIIASIVILAVIGIINARIYIEVSSFFAKAMIEYSAPPPFGADDLLLLLLLFKV